MSLNRVQNTVLALLPLVVQVFGADCDAVWAEGDFPPCPPERVAAYKQMNSNYYMSFCCVPGSDDYKNNALYVNNCRDSICQANDTLANLCQFPSGMDQLYFKGDGASVNYVETVRDACQMDDGQIGIKALCCEANSTDTLLTTLYGAERHEFPHFARIDQEGCGGTIYNERVWGTNENVHFLTVRLPVGFGVHDLHPV